MKVCHKCSLWQALRGRNPNTGEEIDEWKCVDAMMMIGAIEIARAARSGAAATESFRETKCLRLNSPEMYENSRNALGAV